MTETTQTLLSTVAGLLRDKATASIEDKVAETLFEREVNKRAEAIVKVLDLIQQEERELKKIDRPDQVTYGRDKKVQSESFSKGRLDDIEKKTKKIEKLKNAVNKALEKQDCGDLYNAAAGKLKEDDSSGSDKSTGGSEDNS